MKKLSLFFILISFIISCQTMRSHDLQYKGEISPGRWLKKIPVKIKNDNNSSTAMIQIYFPKNYKRGQNLRTLIALHSYNSNERDWEKNTSIERLADKYNFILVCPNMKKSLYETKYYPETKYKWNVIPGGKFVGENLINFLNKNFNIAYNKNSTGIMGVTVGAHGAVLLASKYDAFGATAGISGYYDPTTMASSRMIATVYGKYNKNKIRWENDDNNIKLASKLSGVKVFLFHGTKNDAFTPMQSKLMAIRLNQLKKKSSHYSITYSESKGGYYGWVFWKNQLPDVMEFFNNNLTK